MGISTLDLVIVAIIGVSGLISLFRGAIGEILSLAGWAFAICMPLFFTSQFATFLPASIESLTARAAISASILFVGSFIVAAIFTFLLRRVLALAGLGITDRLLGGVFGGIRGVLVVAILALLATASSTIPQEGWWGESRLMPYVLRVSKILHSQLPPEVARRFNP